MNLLISGGTGSLGHSLVEYYADKFDKVIVFSRDELKQYEMAQEYSHLLNLRFFLGDVRDIDRLKQVCRDVDVVIHTAALKQVPTLEYNPLEAIKTNIQGSVNIIEACVSCGIKKAVLISTDKAVNPVNLYGATKLAAEKLFLAANSYNKTIFSCVRYGNVLGSRGSVVPFFKKLISQGIREFPITDLNMTRFWITLKQAVGLVNFALEDSLPKIYVPKIPSCKITDIAKYLCPDCTFKDIGIRAGEKLHESLISADDWQNIVFVEDNRKISLDNLPYTSYNNEQWLTKELFNELCETDNG